jgi:hypothetical protein
MGRPKGSPNKDKPFRDALRKRLFEAKGDMRRLDRIADELVKAAEIGNVIAIKEVADRMDGRVPQAIVGDDEHDPVKLIVTGVRRAGE